MLWQALTGNSSEKWLNIQGKFYVYDNSLQMVMYDILLKDTCLYLFVQFETLFKISKHFLW